MRRHVWVWIACEALLFHGGFANAQDSLKALEDDLAAAKQQHDDMTTQSLSNFFTQIDAAMGSSDAAIQLYAKANTTPSDDSAPAANDGADSIAVLLQQCGIPPTPVVTEHDTETATEKEARLAKDQANLNRLGMAVELHCGLMHYAALFITKPDQKGLQDDWVAWLKTAATNYPQIAVPQSTGDAPPQPEHKKKRQQGDDGAVPPKPTPPYNPVDLKEKTMHDSIIGKFLGFNLWGDKEQGGWAVKDLPKLYRTNVLDPLRTTPTADTLAAWDVFIAMANADEPDNDKWNQVVYPPLQFDRACDDYAVTPGTDKLENLVNLIKAYPTYPGTSDWITRTRQLMDDYRAHHGGQAPVAQNPTPPAPSTGPNVSVTTVQQGDETIVTTHTNAAPVAPAH